MSIGQKIANIAQKTVTTSLFGLFGFGIYSISNQIMESLDSNSYSQVAVTSPAGQARFYSNAQRKI